MFLKYMIPISYLRKPEQTIIFPVNQTNIYGEFTTIPGTVRHCSYKDVQNRILPSTCSTPNKGFHVRGPYRTAGNIPSA